MNDQENKNSTSKESKKNALTCLENFVREDDSAKYVIDPKNVICRKNDQNTSCVKLNELDEKEIFSQMQKLGFYCALAQDPNKFGIECKKLFLFLSIRTVKIFAAQITETKIPTPEKHNRKTQMDRKVDMKLMKATLIKTSNKLKVIYGEVAGGLEPFRIHMSNEQK